MTKEKKLKTKKYKNKKNKPVSFHRYFFIFILRILMICFAVFFPIIFFIILAYDPSYKYMYEILFTLCFQNKANSKWMNYSYYSIIVLSWIIGSILVISMYVLKFISQRDAKKTKKLALNLLITPLVFMSISFILWALFAFLFKGNTPDPKGDWKNLISGFCMSIHNSYKIYSTLFIWLIITEGIIALFGIWTFIEYGWLKKGKITFYPIIKKKKEEISLFEKVIGNELEFGLDFDTSNLTNDEQGEEENNNEDPTNEYHDEILKIINSHKKLSDVELLALDEQFIYDRISSLDKIVIEKGQNKTPKKIIKEIDKCKSLLDSIKQAKYRESLSEGDVVDDRINIQQSTNEANKSI